MATNQNPGLTDNDYYTCGYLLGAVDTISQCAKDGCRVCQAKLDGNLRD